MSRLMDYQTYPPQKDLSSIIKCYWTLEVPKSDETHKQRIVPDGCIEMAFLLGDDIKRYKNKMKDQFVYQPRAMVIGQITEPFEIEPTGYVNTFAVRFFPFGFSMIHSIPMDQLANNETPLSALFGDKVANQLYEDIIKTKDIKLRIKIIEVFLLDQLKTKSNQERVIQMTVESLMKSNGSAPILSIWNHDAAKVRDMERKFLKLVGLSPKHLGKIIRLQTALKLMLDGEPKSLTQIAYESDYYDQSHFIKDFRKLTGLNPRQFLGDKASHLSTIFYQKN
ncbi:helix-turn-helix domain-containing protein [Leptospira sp. 96542]|nr:helix-turn-helix domain-containing protein [Leptospira sp. 96542]